MGEGESVTEAGVQTPIPSIVQGQGLCGVGPVFTGSEVSYVVCFVQCVLAVHGSALKCIRIQYLTIQFSEMLTVQCSIMQCSSVKCSTMQCSAVVYSTIQYIDVDYNALTWSTVQAVECTAVQYCVIPCV